MLVTCDGKENDMEVREKKTQTDAEKKRKKTFSANRCEG